MEAPGATATLERQRRNVAETETVIQRAEQARDLQGQVAELKTLPQADRREIIFKETSPARVKVPIYSMRDGEKVMVPEYMARRAIETIDTETGKYRFTAHKDRAPKYKLGTIKCFLHKESPEKVVLEEIGLSANPCPKKTLKNNHSRRMHALHRHPEEWKAYEDFIDERTKVEDRDRQIAQLDATLALAGRASASEGASHG